MDGYSSKSTEELRFEDYYLKDSNLMVIKKNLDIEVVDRGREAAACVSMAREEKLMRAWALAADRSWAKYVMALSLYKDGLFDQASELFTLALKICQIGPHSVSCYYYRAVCSCTNVALKDYQNVCYDLSQCISFEPNHSEAQYLLGSVLLKADTDVDWERAEGHLEKAYSIDSASFDEDSTRMEELLRCREGAAHIRLVSAAEAKKTLGNASLARGAYEEAEGFYTSAIEICPDCEKSHIYYCNRASTRCEISMRLDPSPEEALTTLHTAILDCDKSIELQPGYTKAIFRRHFCYGLSAYFRDELEGSLKHYHEALELDPTNAIVKQEVRKVQTAIDVIKAKERVIEIEKEVAAREALRAEEREKEKKLLEEKKVRDEQIRREKAEKLEVERVERARVKAEREMMKSEKGKAQAEEEEKEKEEKKMEKDKLRIAREQEKIEERDRKKLEREKEKQKAKDDKVDIHLYSCLFVIYMFTNMFIYVHPHVNMHIYVYYIYIRVYTCAIIYVEYIFTIG